MLKRPSLATTFLLATYGFDFSEDIVVLLIWKIALSYEIRRI